MSISEFENASDVKNVGRFLRLSEVEESVGLRKTKIYELVKDKSDPFPSPIHIGTCAVSVKKVNVWKSRLAVKLRN